MRRLLVWLTVTAVVVIAAAGIGAHFLFGRPQGDPLTTADAIVVLGGDPDGRVDYGLRLAREGYADTVVLSNSYGEDDPVIRRACASGTSRIEVVCFVPDPWTTRGEAIYTADLARKRGWRSLIVVTWNFHIVRARYIFEQCFDGRLIMEPVPRDYHDYGPLRWVYTYAYQYAAMVKAAILQC